MSRIANAEVKPPQDRSRPPKGVAYVTLSSGLLSFFGT